MSKWIDDFKELSCPINHEILINPVTASDGCTYEEHQIKKWMTQNKKQTSPLTNMRLSTDILIKNMLIQQMARKFKYQKCVLCQSEGDRYKKRGINIEEVQEETRTKEEKEESLNQMNFALRHYYARTKTLEECIVEMEKAYQMDPKNWIILREYANVLRFASKYKYCFEIMDKLKEILPHSLLGRAMEIRILAEQGHKEKSFSIMDQIMYEKSIEEMMMIEIRTLAYSFSSTGLIVMDKLFIDAYLTAIPNDSNAISHKIYTLLHLKQYNDALILADQYLALYGNDISVFYSKADAYSALDQKHKAIEIYRQLLSFSVIPKIKSNCYYEIGLLENDDAQVKKCMKLSYQIDPGENADRFMTCLSADKKNYAKAKKWLDRCKQRIDIKNEPILMQVEAEIYYSRGEMKEAIETYLLLIELDNVNRAYYNVMINRICVSQEIKSTTPAVGEISNNIDVDPIQQIIENQIISHTENTQNNPQNMGDDTNNSSNEENIAENEEGKEENGEDT